MIRIWFKYPQKSSFTAKNMNLLARFRSLASSIPRMGDYHVFLSTLQSTFLLYIHQYSYKNGAFKQQITQKTSPLNALHRLIASPLLNSAEKDKFRELRDTLITLQQSNPESLSGADILRRTMPFRNVSAVFQADLRSRSQSSSSSPRHIESPSMIGTVMSASPPVDITYTSGKTIGARSSMSADWSATTRQLQQWPEAAGALLEGREFSESDCQDYHAQQARALP